MPQQILDYNTPSVNPIGAPPNDYLRVQANPGAFAAKGQAIQGLGGAFEKVGQAATDIAEFHDRINVDDQVNHWISQRDVILNGDPTKQITGPDGQPQPDRGYMGLQGRSASDARAGTLQALEDARIAGRNNLKSPMAQLAYDQQTRRMYSVADNAISEHARQQWTNWAGGVNNTGAAHELNAFVNSLDNPEEATGHIHNYINFRVQEAQTKFGDDPQIKQQAEERAKQELLAAQVDAVAVKDPKRADQILDSNKNTAGALYDNMKAKLRSRMNQQVGDEAAQKALTSARGGNFSAPVNDAIRGAAARYGINPATLTRTAQIESGGNPSAVTGSYKGLFQLSESEFRKYGPPGGDINNPNDNAMAAAGKMRAEGQEFAALNGRQPNAFDQYMIHQQGVAGYSAHLANPNAPAWQNMLSTGEGRQKGEAWAKAAIWGNIPDQYKAGFGSVNNVTSRDFINMWAAKFGQGGAPAMPAGQPTLTGGTVPAQFQFPPEESLFGGQGRGAIQAGAFPVPNTASVIKPTAMQNLIDDPSLKDNPEAFDQAYRKVATALQAQEIAENQNTKLKKQAAEDAADEHLKTMTAMMHTPNPDYVALTGKINADPRLDYETRKGLLDRVRHMSGEEQALAFGPGYLAARQALFSPSDAPGHINDFSQLVNDPTITTAGLADLRQRLSLVKGDVDRQALERRVNSFLIGAKKDLSFEEDNGFIKIRDPKGEQIYNYQFVPDFVKRASDLVQDAEKTGDRKKLDDFLSVENVQKLVRSYRSKKDMDADKLVATGQSVGVTEDPNAPLPPAPEGIEDKNWKAVVANPPMLTTGQAATHAQWAQALTLLNSNPSPQMMANFDRYFAPAGLTAIETLRKINPAAAIAAEKTGNIGAEEAGKSAAPADSLTSQDNPENFDDKQAPEISEFQRQQQDPSNPAVRFRHGFETVVRQQQDPHNPAVRFRRGLEIFMHPERAQEKRHPEDEVLP